MLSEDSLNRPRIWIKLMVNIFGKLFGRREQPKQATSSPAKRLYDEAHTLQYSSGDWEAAVPIYQQIIRDYAASAEAGYSKSQLAGLTKKHPGVNKVKDPDSSKSEHNEKIAGYYEYACDFLSKGEVAIAHQLFKEIVRDYPDSKEAQLASEQLSGVEKRKNAPEKSRYLPDFPLTPVCEIEIGTPLKGETLAAIASVGISITREMERWHDFYDPSKWPEFANDELRVLMEAYEGMEANAGVGVSRTIDRDEIAELAGDYLNQLKSVPEAMEKFAKAELTLFGITMDFAATLGYERSLTNALNRWQEGFFR